MFGKILVRQCSSEHAAATRALLDDLQAMLRALKATSSTKEKASIVCSYPQLHSLLAQIYSPGSRFYMTSKALDKVVERSATPTNVCIEALLASLSRRAITGHAAILAVQSTMTMYPEHRELIKQIIDRNLQARVNWATIQPILASTVSPASPMACPLGSATRAGVDAASKPHFPIALGYSANDLKYQKHLRKSMAQGERWYVSRKLDGVRCIMTVNASAERPILLYSRAGKELTNLGKFAGLFSGLGKAAESLGLGPIVLDGELCIMKRQGDRAVEDFKATVSVVKRKCPDIQAVSFVAFDMMSAKNFLAARDPALLSHRLQHLDEFSAGFGKLPIRMLEQKPLGAYDEIDMLRQNAAKDGWEGLVLRRDAAYVGKRTRDFLKVKYFEEIECKVVDVVLAPMATVVDGCERQETLLASVLIRYQDNVVNVGSGFSLEERRRYAASPGLIIGKQITVKYFSESSNAEGSVSLRFPVVKAVFEEGERSI